MAQAQATRTWVSGVGDDVNPCSRTAPCKTFAGAISKTAAGGEISVLDPGGFGTINIIKAITIDGTNGAGHGSILSSGVNGVIVNAGVNDIVTLRNLTINGAGLSVTQNGVNGIRYVAGGALVVDKCTIHGFTQQGIDAGSMTNNGQLMVKDTNIYNIGQNGIRLATTAGQIIATIERTQVQKAVTGLRAGDRTRVAVRDSVFSHNTNGLISESAANDSQVNVDNCFFTYGNIGIQAGTGTTTVRVTRSTIVQNATAISLAGGSVLSNGNNSVWGNSGGEAFTGGAPGVVPLK
jgi:hypothetical protein